MKCRPITRFLVLAALAVAALSPTAWAQDLELDRVQQALDRTDERIEVARTLVSDADNAQAEMELNAAIDLQARARSEFAALRLRVALDLTFKARARADRAISILRGLPDPERVLAQLERTRDLIDRARDRIEECEHDRARALLRVAAEMQVRAEAAARESRWLAALQLTLSARERALRALRICNMEENLNEAAERALQRTDEVIARARDIVADHPNEQARNALRRAESLQAEAYAQFRAGHFEASLRLTQSARAMAHRAVRLAGGKS
jgi:hypothetical protein